MATVGMFFFGMATGWLAQGTKKLIWSEKAHGFAFIEAVFESENLVQQPNLFSKLVGVPTTATA